MKILTLKQLRAELVRRIEEAGGCTAFARQNGLTHAAWSNVVYDHTRRPGPEMLARLGYVEEPPRYRLVKEKTR